MLLAAALTGCGGSGSVNGSVMGENLNVRAAIMDTTSAPGVLSLHLLEVDEKKALMDAYEQVEEQEDMHLYHTMGWARELWIEALGMPAVLPPPEEEKKVVTAIGASRAEQSRDEML